MFVFFCVFFLFFFFKNPKYSRVSIKIYSNFNIYERILFQETFLYWCTRVRTMLLKTLILNELEPQEKNLFCYPSIICQFLLRCSSMFKMKCNLLWNKNKYKTTTTSATTTTTTTTDTEETNRKLLQSVQWIAVILV